MVAVPNTDTGECGGVSLISILDGLALNWSKPEDLRAQNSATTLFGKVK